MGNFERIGDIVGNSTSDLYRLVREHQYQTRRSEVEAMRARHRDRESYGRQAPEDAPIPDDVLDEMDRILMDPNCEIRHKILPCETQPYKASFCDGSAHMRRAFSEIYHKWVWRFYEFCPVGRAEIDIASRHQPKEAPTPTGPYKRGR